MPASFCGIVGLKPTWGLVPYTGAIGLDASIDHLGPMTKNVADCALLLQVIAGVDGLDDRQQGASARGKVRYAEQLDQFLRVTDKEPCKSLQGIRIGILTEGFGLACSNSNVDELVQSSAQRLKALGATVMKVSVPGHSRGQKLWGVAKFMGSYRGAALGYAQARKQVYMPERVSRLQVGQQEFDAAGPGARSMMLSGMFLEKRHGPGLYARCKNLLRKLSVTSPLYKLWKVRLLLCASRTTTTPRLQKSTSSLRLPHPSSLPAMPHMMTQSEGWTTPWA